MIPTDTATGTAPRTATLPGGLRVLVAADPDRPLAAVSLRFGTGSRHDPAEFPGFAHLFEHLMFGGTPRTPRGTHLRRVQEFGGNANARTSTDSTAYFHVVPTEALDTVFALDGDRLRTLRSGIPAAVLDAERSVVRSEYLGSVGRPYGDAVARIAAALYGAHPYGHLPLGDPDALDRARPDDADAFFRAHCTPDRAVLAVTGPVRTDEVLDLITRHFGDWLDGGPAAASPQPSPPPARRVEWHAHPAAPPRLFVGVLLPAAAGPDYDLHRLLALLLAEGPDSRLPRRLGRERGLLADVRVRPMGQTETASLCVLELVPAPGGDTARLAAAWEEEMGALVRDGVTEEEWACALGRHTARRLARRDLLATHVDDLSAALLHGGQPPDPRALGSVTQPQLREALKCWSGRDGLALLHCGSGDA